MKEVKLTKGFVALVDDEDFERVKEFVWKACLAPDTVYAQRNLYNAEGKRTTQYMHRFILRVIDSKVRIDHEDHNGLNCQKYNMRIATGTQNNANQRKQKRKTLSRFKGVSQFKPSGKWVASIKVHRKQIYLGAFMVEEEAAFAYDKAAQQYFGEFALTNF